jgi:hypothetical protein
MLGGGNREREGKIEEDLLCIGLHSTVITVFTPQELIVIVPILQIRKPRLRSLGLEV